MSSADAASLVMTTVVYLYHYTKDLILSFVSSFVLCDLYMILQRWRVGNIPVREQLFHFLWNGEAYKLYTTSQAISIEYTR